MDEKDIVEQENEFSLDDIIKEFSDHSHEPEEKPETLAEETLQEPAPQEEIQAEESQQDVLEQEPVAVTSDTIRI